MAANEQTTVKETLGNDYEFLTAVDLSAQQYTQIKLDTNNLAVIPSAGDPCVGILQNAPKGTAAKPVVAVIRVWGASKLLLAGTVLQGSLIKTDGAGAGVVASVNKDRYNAIAKTSGSSGDYILVTVEGGQSNI